MSADSRRGRAWLVDKPAGPTSHDVVAEIRGRLPRGTKVGHAGTLDPFATGLLIILAGRATRLADRVSGQSKSYRATVRLGMRSETGDPEGPCTPGGPPPPRAQIAAAVHTMPGWTSQRVPSYSAVRVGGERLYQRVRRGESVDPPERPIQVHEARLVDVDPGTGDVTIDVRVSKGTYVRQLAVDLGEVLGCGAYCLALRRTAVGPFTVADAVAPDRVPDAPTVPLTELLTDMPIHVAPPEAVAQIVHGRTIPAGSDAGSGEVVVANRSGELVAIADCRDGRLHPVSVFQDAEPT